MHYHPPEDMDTLLQRLCAAAAEHSDAVLAKPVQVRAWALPGTSGSHGSGAAAPALPWGLVARHGGLAPYLLADEAAFAALAYQRLLGRAPDGGGAAHLTERLRQHTPRTELLAGLVLSPEARQLHLQGQALQRVLATALLGGLRVARGLRSEWLVRGVLRRSERWLAQRAQRSALGLSWDVALRSDAAVHTLHAQLAGLQAQLQQQQEQADERHGEQQRLVQDLQAETSQHQHQQQALVQAQAAAEAALQRASAALHARLQAQAQRLEQLQAQVQVQQLQKKTHAQTPAQGPEQAPPPETAPGAEPAATAAATTRHLATTPMAARVDDSAAVDDFLASLEAAFRGPVQDLQAQLARDYLPQLQALRAQLGDGPCLDLGCGRGVWLQLLQEQGFAARGIDLNAAAVSQAQAQGLDAHCGDALAWLRAQPEGSALAITAFHLVEHLPFALRLALVTECARVLRPGGLLILETPNPENIWVATHTFHHDPTHSQPLTPDSLEFLVNYCGLQTVAVPRLHPYPPEAGLPGDDPVTLRLNHMTCGGQDFAVVARRPAGP